MFYHSAWNNLEIVGSRRNAREPQIYRPTRTVFQCVILSLKVEINSSFPGQGNCSSKL